MKKFKALIEAFRLRTLALSLSVNIMGSAIAFQHGCFSLKITLLAMLTTLFLQILSNLSNDYGDTVNGVDNEQRVGPQRMVQSGRISISEMKNAMITISVLAFVSGVLLLIASYNNIDTYGFLFFLIVGIAAIAAAIKYTVGKKPYGYIGLGDISVFIFFGLVGVCGTYILQSGTPSVTSVIAASAIGFLSTGVLNMNNMRDIENDKTSGKRTLIVIIGYKNGRIYQICLILFAWIFLLYCTLSNYNSYWQLIYLATLPLFAKHICKIISTDEPRQLDGQLKLLSISTLITVLLFFIGLIL